MRKAHLVAVIVAVWGVGTVLAFWAFEGRYLRPVSRPPGAALARPTAPPPAQVAILTTDRGTVHLGEAGPVTVLNFWNPDCPCSRFAEKSVRRLAAQYEPRGVRVITVVASGPTPEEGRQALAHWRSRGILAEDAAVADTDNRAARALGVWAAPAAVILDTQGRVAYVGAYNAARYCDDARTAWAAQALAAVVRGRSPSRASTAFFGCQLLSAKS